MADSFKTLADLVMINDRNLADRNISDILDDAPLLALLPADTCPDTTHKYVKEITAPTVGFRAVNDGRFNSKSVDELVTQDLKILDASFAVDQAIAKGYKNGDAAYIAKEAARHLRAAFFQAEKQFINGTGNDAAGFLGMAQTLTGAAGTLVVDAEGSSAGAASSVYAIRATGDLNNLVAISGKNGSLEMGETVAVRLDGTTGTYPGFYTPIFGWLGLQIGGKYSIARLCNITVGKPLTDDLLAELIALFPAGGQPTHLVMNRRSRQQLQKSRTATNATGAPAPFPEDAFGVPIVPTDAILNTESIVNVS